ncbi:MAG: HTH-type transcriptional repressor NanR [Sodalis sp.]|nr:MAG: HTH-type transcriptional repressor NanR [Sodalis sp.]
MVFNVGRPSVRKALGALKRKGLRSSANQRRVASLSADIIISELFGMAKDFLSRFGGIAHFEQLRPFFEFSLESMRRTPKLNA